MTTLIKVPFADSGDKSVIPATDAAGKVNWSQGFTPDYSKDPNTDPSAKRIEREDFNGLMNTLSVAIKEIQSVGVAPFITAADNGGSAFAYSKGALVFYNKAVWRSKVDANTVIPVEGDSWSQLIAAESLGTAAGKNIGTSSGQIPTMDNFELNASPNGYIKMPNGLYIQWRTVSGMGPATQPNPTRNYLGWITPFPNACIFYAFSLIGSENYFTAADCAPVAYGRADRTSIIACTGYTKSASTVAIIGIGY